MPSAHQQHGRRHRRALQCAPYQHLRRQSLPKSSQFVLCHLYCFGVLAAVLCRTCSETSHEFLALIELCAALLARRREFLEEIVYGYPPWK